MAIAADIQQQVYDLLSRSSSLSFVTADQEGSGRTALTPGQRVTAEVVGTLPNNRAQVRVGNERFNLDLPMAVRLGQTLEMTFVSEDPRSTFAIARQGGVSPPVSLSDASRLLSLLISSEQILDPRLRSSLQNIGDMLRRSSGEAGVLANLLDEALTYGALREGVKATPQALGDSMQEPGNKQTQMQPGSRQLTQDQSRLAAFESNAAQILRNIAHSSRFILVEAANLPQTPLPLMPGEEVNAVVVGSTLPGGRTFVQIAGTALELVLPRTITAGELLRLTYISSQPKPTFAIPRTQPDTSPGSLSEAGRWLSVLEHLEGGVSDQQMHVLERLNTVLKSLPPDSPAFTAILDEAITYQTVMRSQAAAEQSSSAAALSAAGQTPVPFGNGIVLSDDMAKLLQAVIKGNRLALLESLSQQAAPTGFNPGQQLKGEVLAALGGGRFMVQVAGQTLEFTMPKGIRRGDMLNLFFITEEPQSTFLMTRFGKPGDARVSDTGRWLSGFLGAAAEQLPPQTAIGLLRILLSSAPTDAPQVGQMLQQGLRDSGLFYESHLTRWFGGEYPLDDLLKEPQGRLSPRMPQPVVQQPGTAADALAQAGLGDASTEIMEAVFKKAGSGMSHEGIADQRTLPIVSEQLSTLQNGQHVFRGDLFPGQPMEWTVAERDAHRNGSGVRERTWETSVDITLPRLGPIKFRLALDGTLVSVDIRAEDSAVVPQLAAGRVRLTEQLEAAGLTPADMNIRHAGS
ncbi:MAG: flagellar hook-length control protein FliK [Steroidobacteraceae bacterium]|nr:flagellar hook-length control protein FliK [Deltaproteobacteria bacterium]